MAEMIGPSLRTDRLVNGERELVRPLIIRSRGHKIVVPDGFRTDFSSYPRILITIILAIFLWLFDLSPLWSMLLLLIPAYYRTDISGVVHDWLIMTQEVSWFESILIWVDVARSGQVHVWWIQGIAGLLGLVVGSWIPWIRYGRRRGDPRTLELIKKSDRLKCSNT